MSCCGLGWIVDVDELLKVNIVVMIHILYVIVNYSCTEY